MAKLILLLLGVDYLHKRARTLAIVGWLPQCVAAYEVCFKRWRYSFGAGVVEIALAQAGPAARGRPACRHRGRMTSRSTAREAGRGWQ